MSALPIQIQSGWAPKRIETGLMNNMRPHWMKHASYEQPEPVSIHLQKWITSMQNESGLSKTTFSVDTTNLHSNQFSNRFEMAVRTCIK